MKSYENDIMKSYENDIEEISRVNIPNFNQKFNLFKKHPNIPIIFYINLKNQINRKKHIINQFKKIQYPFDFIIRIDAVKKDDGHYGCTLSHIKTLMLIKKLNINNAIILEDDCIFRFNKEYTKKILIEILNDKEWSVALLGGVCTGGVTPRNKFSKKIICNKNTKKCCNHTHSYLIRKKYIDKLMNLWIYLTKKNISYSNNSIKIINGKTIDVLWQFLQRIDNDKWIISNPILTNWISSYSSTIKSVREVYSINNNKNVNITQLNTSNV